MTKAEKQAQRESSRNRLLAMIEPGMRIYTILRHRSASGMQRRVSMLIAINDADRGVYIQDITYSAAMAMDRQLAPSKGEGIVVNGCGFDAGYDLVYGLGATLWPKGTEHSHSMRNGVPDKDGGYALVHSWL